MYLANFSVLTCIARFVIVFFISKDDVWKKILFFCFCMNFLFDAYKLIKKLPGRIENYNKIGL